MSTLTSLARAQAVERGRAVAACTVRHLHISDRPLVFVPLALAGEANAPLAAMIGDGPASPQLLVVAQPRNRDQRFAFAGELADVIVPHIEGFFGVTEAVPGGRGREERTRFADAPQILVPGPAAVGFARLLGRSTRFRRTDGEYAVAASVPLLGRWLTFLCERAEYPGSSLLLAVTDALAMHWATGQSPAEDRNLASLVGWIDPPPGLTGSQAAAAAEDPVAWPPAGPATDPTFDNEVLAPLMAAHDQAAASGSEHARQRALSALEQALAGQLAPTWRLMWQAIGLLRGLPPGEHVALRWDADKDAVTGFADYLDDGGAPQPRRDGAVAAARRLARLERMQASVGAQRAFDDPLLMAEHRLGGEAFSGPVVAAEPDRLDASGPRRKLRPHITVSTTDPVLAAPGAALTSPARPRQEARVVSASEAGQHTRVVVELLSGMGRGLTAAPGSVPEVGETVCYATFGDGYQPPPAFPEPLDTPWTHGGPPPQYLPTDDDAQEAWS